MTADPDVRKLFDSLVGLYLMLDPELTIIAVNDTYLGATGKLRDEVLGRGIIEVFGEISADSDGAGSDELAASLERVQRDLVADTTAAQKYTLRRPEDLGGGIEDRHWTFANSPILDDGRQLLYILHRLDDATELAQLRAANDRLLAASKARDEFLSRMSHELRTPLNSVLGFAQILEHQDLTADQQESVNFILEAGKSLLALINGVLDLSRMASGRLSISNETLKIGDVIEEAINQVRPLAISTDVQISFNSSTDQCVTADRGRLKQVLVSLLTNAIRYNHPGGGVAIDIANLGPDRLGVSVSDTGIGISGDRFQMIFEPFASLGAGGSAIKGVGLGLPVSKGLVEAMGGRLEVTSTPDVGSVFTFDLRLDGPSGGNNSDVATGGT